MTDLSVEKMVVKYDDLSAAIATMTKEYMKLTIEDVKDTKGYELVHAARMDVKSKRVTIQHQEQAFKDVLNTKKKEIVGQAREIYEELKPIESYLDKIEDDYLEEKEIIRVEKERVEKERVAAIQFKISLIRNVAQHLSSSTSLEIKELHKSMKNTEITESVYQEFEPDAERAKSETLMTLATAYNNRKTQEKADEERRAEDVRLAEERKANEAAAKALEERAREVREAEEALEAKAETTPETKETIEASLDAIDETVKNPDDPTWGEPERTDKVKLEDLASRIEAIPILILNSPEATAIARRANEALRDVFNTLKDDIENL